MRFVFPFMVVFQASKNEYRTRNVEGRRKRKSLSRSRAPVWECALDALRQVVVSVGCRAYTPARTKNMRPEYAPAITRSQFQESLFGLPQRIPGVATGQENGVNRFCSNLRPNLMIGCFCILNICSSNYLTSRRVNITMSKTRLLKSCCPK